MSKGIEEMCGAEKEVEGRFTREATMNRRVDLQNQSTSGILSQGLGYMSNSITVSESASSCHLNGVL